MLLLKQWQGDRSQFVALLKEHETDHGDIGYNVADRWFG